MQLYYMETMNPQKVCATAKHLGLAVEYVRVDVAAGGLRTPEYLAMNPNGRAPVLKDGDQTLWESAAIMVHFAAKAGSDMWPLADPRAQADVLRWISWDLCEFMPHAGAFYFEHHVKPMFRLGPPDAASLVAKTPEVHRAAKILDDHLAGRTFLVGDHLTVADFCVGVLLHSAERIALPVGGYRNIRRWHDGLMQLPAWRDPWPAPVTPA